MVQESLTETLRETLAVFDGSGAPWTTTEVADRLELGRRSTYERLERLVDHGELETKKVGANARVWWRPSDDGETGSGGPFTKFVDRVPGTVYRCHHDQGRPMSFVSDGATHLTGYSRDALASGDVSWERDVVHPEDVDRVRASVSEQLDAGDQFTVEYRILTADGETRWVRDLGARVDEDGTPADYEGILVDVTAERRSSQELTERDRQFNSLVQALEEYAIFVLDAEGRVQTWNEGAERIKGYTAEEILGEHVATFYTDEDRASDVPEANLAAAAEQGSTQDEGWRVRADGSTFWAHVTITAHYDDEGELEGFAKVTRDMTDRREREQAVQRERNLLNQILETSPVGIALLDRTGTIVRANERAEQLLGLTVSEMEGRLYDEPEWNIWHEGGDPVTAEEHPVTHVLETAEKVIGFTHGVTLPDGTERWLSSNSAPVFGEDGTVEQVIVALEDVTRLKEQARRLERQRDDLESELQDVFDRISDGFYALDENLRLTFVNDHAEQLLGLEESAVVGQDVRSALSLTDEFRAALRTAREERDPVFMEDYYEPLGAWFENAIYPSSTGVSVYFRDVTERKQREHELEQYEAVVETVDDGIYVVDGDGCFQIANEAYCDIVGRSRAELLGAPIETVVDQEVLAQASRTREEHEPGDHCRMEFDLETADGDVRSLEVRYVLRTADGGDSVGSAGVVRDITERKRRERELEESERRYRTLVDNFPNGAVALFDENLTYLTVGGEVYENLAFSAAELEGERLTDRLPESLMEVFEPKFRAVFDGESTEFEYEFEGEIRQFRVLPVFDESGDVFAGMAVSQDVSRQRERERELERQREQLTALNNLNSIVRDITVAVIEQSTREEIEQIVCERLAASDSYSFAWVGDVDVQTQTVNLRTEAGVEGYLDGVTISVDPDDERSTGPTGQAILEREMQVTRDVHGESTHDPWRNHVDAHGFSSSAAIPIHHDESLYGVLNVYTDRPLAFTEAERTVIRQLGEVMGHAIASVERKRALMSEEVVELEFTIRDVFEAVGVPVSADGTITLDRTVPVGGDTFLEYGTATGDAMEAITALVESEAVPHWESVTVLRTDGDTSRFELRLTEPPVLSTVADHGGYVQEARIQDGDYYMCIHLTPHADVRQVVDAIQRSFPTMEIVSQRQVSRNDLSAFDARDALLEALTERQRTAVEAAYYAGFFEWPRDSSGEDVASSLGVSSPTFHQHLRKALKSLLATVFEESPSDAAA